MERPAFRHVDPTTMPPPPSRLAYIDWMRGLACVLMFQTHCYDSWLGGAARQSCFFMYSQLGGTFPAALFLFLAGISFALVTEKLWQKNLPPSQVARATILRGAEVFGFGLLFRLQEYVLGWGWSPKTDLLRVDILNTIGLSMMLMGLLCWIATGIFEYLRNEGDPFLPSSARQEWRSFPIRATIAAILTTAAISLLAPLLWTTWRPRWLPWPLESYIDGVHNLGVPQSWLFPIFPWAAFAFAGLAAGFMLQSDWARAHETRTFFLLGAAGIALIQISRWLDAQPRQLYPVYDYWHTSPNFFLVRLGMLMVILTASYAWCRWIIGVAQVHVSRKWLATIWGFSPLILLGQASLLVYWVHIEFVYGRASILPKRSSSIPAATLGLLMITLAMLALAYARTRMKGKGSQLWAALTKPSREALTG